MPVLAEKMKSGSHNPVSARISPYIDRLCDVEKAAIAERYGLYPENHPLTKYIRSLPIAQANPDIKIFVTKRWDEINAMALPDGSVFLSDRLLDFCIYKEELEFVIQHEIRHIQGKHAAKRLGEKGVAVLGRSRINEYEADLADMLKDKKTSVNPYGGMVFLERLAEHEKSEEAGFDPIHGGTYTRLINVEHAVRIVDMDALTTELNEIPGIIKAQAGKQMDPWSAFDALIKLEKSHVTEADFENAKEAAKEVGLVGAISNLETVYGSGLTKTQKDELISLLSGVIEKDLRAHYPQATEEGIKAFRAFLMQNAVSHDANIFHRNLRRELFQSPAFDEFVEMLRSFPESLPVTLKPVVLRIIFDAFATRLESENPHDAYAKATVFLSSIRQALSRCGIELSFESEETTLALMLMKTFGREEPGRFIDKLKESGLNASPSEIYEAACAYFGLSEENELVADPFFASLQAGAFPQDKSDKVKKLKSMTWKESGRMNAQAATDLAIMTIAPKDFDDLLSFLDAYTEGKEEAYRASSSSERFLFGKDLPILDGLLQSFPEITIPELLKRVGAHPASNQQIISLVKALRPIALIDPMLVILGFHQRRYSNEELEQLAHVIGPELTTFPVLFNLKQCKSRAEAFELLDFALSKGFATNKAVIHFTRARDRRSGDEGLTFEISADASDIALHIFRNFKFNMKNRRQLDELLTASCFITDPNLKLRLQKRVLKCYTALLDEREAYELLFNDRRVADYAAIEAREEYLDGMVRDPQELSRIKKDLVERVQKIDSKLAGAIVLEETVAQILLTDKERLLKALLLTRRSNAELRFYIAEIFLAAHLNELERGGDYSLYISSIAGLTDQDSLEGRLPAENFEELLYGLDYEARHVLCNALLIGKDGVLLDRAKRVQTLEWFFETFIEKPTNESEEKVYEFLKLAFSAVAENSNVSTLYFLVHPIIVERILGKPTKKVSWDASLRKAKGRVLDKVCNDEEDRYYFGDTLDASIDVVKKFIRTGHNVESEKDHEQHGYGKHLQATENTEIELNRLCMAYLSGGSDIMEKLTPVEFVKHLSSKMGAPGVRFLQSLGIYANLPPELRKEFDEVYDSVKGQLKLSALHTLEKSGVEGIGLESFGSRIGGGSLVTVYESTVEGKKCALKVVNPNVSYRADTICDNLVKIFASDEKLARGLPLIENIRIWIKEDVSLKGTEYAEAFRSQNHGFRAEGNEYAIRVPGVVRRSGKYLAEEFVEGLNLTKWDDLAKDHDMRKVISLVVKNAVQQLSNGLVHADMHVGNIRLTDGKEIFWLDNNYLIVLSEHDKGFLGSLVILAGDKPAVAKAVADYLCSFDQNSQVERESLQARLAERLSANGYNDAGSLISDIVAIVAEHKGVIPLNVMLLMKNALALDRMAQRAGFRNVLEAFTYEQHVDVFA